MPTSAPDILLVEDNPINRKVLLRQLLQLGYSAEFATNGQEALDMLAERNGRVDIILMDCQMPVLDGYAATREIRRQEQETNRPRVAIVAVTAHANVGDREKCLDAGMDDYLTKPVDMQLLGQTLERWLAIVASGANGNSSHSTSDRDSSSSSTMDIDIDADRLDEITGGDAEFQRELIETFVEDAAEKLVQIRQALQSRDATAVAGHAHTLKGASGNVGVTSIQVTAEKMEFAAKNGDLDAASQRMDELDRFLEGTRSFAAGLG